MSARLNFQGLLLRDRRVTAVQSAAIADYSEQAPLVGSPQDQSNPRSAMVLEVGGTQEAGAQLRLQANRAGFPGADDRAGGFVYRDAADNDDYFGWDTPNAITGWEWLDYVADANTAERHQQPQMIRLQSGNGLLVNRCSGTALTGSTSIYQVRVMQYDGAAGTWAEIAQVPPKSPTSSALYPCLLQLPNGRVQLYFWVVNAAADEAQVEMWFSDDDGATWSVGNRFCLETAVDTSEFTLGRLRCAYNAGQVLLVGGLLNSATHPTVLAQWASDDLGVRFVTAWLDDDPSAGDCGSLPEVLATSNGGFAVVYYNTPDGTPKIRQIGSAWSPLSDVTATSIAAFTWLTSSIDLAVWAGEDGAWYATTQVPSVAANQLVIRSVDEGATWSRMDSGTTGDPVEGIWFGGDDTNYLTDFTGCEVRGRSILVSRAVVNTADHSLYSLMALYLGGHSTLTMPSHSLFSDDVTQLAWARTWIAIEEPDNFSGVWVRSTSGSPTIALTASGLQLTTPTGSDAVSYKETLDATVAKALVVYAKVRVDSGSGATALRVCLADGTHDYRALISVTTTGFSAGDYYGSPDADAPAVDTTGGIEFLIGVKAGALFLWYRQSSSNPERRWTQWSAGNGATLSDHGAGTANGFVSWGFFGSNAATAHWNTHCRSYMPTGLDGLAQGFDNPDDLFSRFFSRTGGQLPGGARIKAIDGPCVVGDAWNVDATAQYPVANIHPPTSPSPRAQWRSADNAQQVLAWDISDVGDADMESTSVGVALIGTNVPAFSLYGVDHTGSPHLIGSAVTNGYSSLKYLRHGNTITVNTGATTASGSKWIAKNELAGGWVEIDNGSGSNKKRRTILGNSEGRWYADNGRHPVLLLDGVDDSESTSGDCRLVFPNVAAVFHAIGAYSSYKLVIAAATTPTGDFRIGNLVLGPVAVFGQQYSFGRTMEMQPATELHERRSGTRYSRNLGPGRRKVEIAWTDAVDTSPTNATPSSTSTPTAIQLYTGSAGANYVAVGADTPALVDGLIDQLRGPDELVVYLPTLRSGSATQQVMFHRDELLYGRITTSARREAELGDESATEMQRIATLAIEEER